MLLGQQLGRRHESGLQPAAGGARSGGRRDDRLAATDIALQQAHHGKTRREISLDIPERARLGAGQSKRQRRDEPPCQPLAVGERPGRVGLRRPLAQLERQVMRQQLLEREAPLRGVAAGGELRLLRFARRRVHVSQRILEGRQSQWLAHLGRNPVAHRAGLELAQRLPDERPQAALRNALRQRIDRRQGVFQRRRLLEHAPVFRVNDLQAEGPAPYLSEAAQARAAREPLLLRRREVEEAQRQESGAVRDPTQQLPPLAIRHLGELDLPFHGRARAGGQRADRPHAGAVLVAQRQHEEQVLDLCDAETLQAFGECRADPAQGGDRPLLGAGGRPVRGRLSQGAERPRSRRARRAATARLRPRRAPGRAVSSRSP